MTCWFGERLHYMALGFHTYDLYPTDLLVSSVLWHKCQSGFLLSCNTSMMTSSNGNIFRVTGPLCGEFTGPGEFPTQRPVTRSFDVYFDLGPNEWLSKQWRRWWFKIPSRSLWRHCNDSPCKWCCESWNARLPTQPTEEWKLEMHAIKRIKSIFFCKIPGHGAEGLGRCVRYTWALAFVLSPGSWQTRLGLGLHVPAFGTDLNLYINVPVNIP